MKKICGSLLWVLATMLHTEAGAQMLFSESFVVILDTTKSVKGRISPGIELQNQKEKLYKFSNSADLAIRMGRHVMGVASSFEVIKYADEVLLSDCFVYSEWRADEKPIVSPEYYVFYQRMGARGMEDRAVGGVNLRVKLRRDSSGAIYAGLGPFYEYEEWNHRGVQEQNLPANPENVTNKQLKYGLYLGVKQRLFEVIFLDLSCYYQNGFTNQVEFGRIGFDGILSYRITRHVSLALNYQLVRDPEPLVPISDQWYKAFTRLNLNF